MDGDSRLLTHRSGEARLGKHGFFSFEVAGSLPGSQSRKYRLLLLLFSFYDCHVFDRQLNSLWGAAPPPSLFWGTVGDRMTPLTIKEKSQS